MSRFVKVAKASVLAENGKLAVEAEGRSIALFKVDERVFAVDNYCPHAGYVLDDGELDGKTVVCALHGATFDLADGRCVGGPRCSDIQAYATRVTKGGDIELEMDS